MPISTADIAKIYENDSELRKSDVEALKHWASKQPHLPKISELQLILFLNSCYYSNELAKTTIDNYFTIKTLCPEMFGNRNPKERTVQEAMNCVSYCPLPILTPPPNNYQVILMKMMDYKPENWEFCNQIRNFDMVAMLYLHKYGPQNGLVLVIDLQGLVLRHLTRLNIAAMKTTFQYLQEAMPIRLKGIHFINAVPFVDKIFASMKPFAKKGLFDMMRVHANSIESLYEFVPQECLPAEYGGRSGPFNVLHEKLKKEINDNAEYFQYEEGQKVDESKRPGKPKTSGDILGMEGTFRKLEVD